jgi:predicted nucleotidyltransferase
MALGIALVDLPLDEALQGVSISAVYAYGSMTQPGRASRASDLDLLIVGDVRDRDALIERLTEVGRRLGRAVDAFILTPEQVEEAKGRDDAHVVAALAGVRIRGRV